MSMTKSLEDSHRLASLRSLAGLATTEGIREEVEAAMRASRSLGRLAGGGEQERIARGFGHTLREIVQQPLVWADTAQRAVAFAENEFPKLLREGGFECVVMTGSGSSQYAADLAAPALETRLRIPVRAVASGDILAYGIQALPVGTPLVISFARSGNSPESSAVLRVVMAEQPKARFLNLTCNALGKLATSYAKDARVSSILLHHATHDESLVMTSSFTSMALAAVGLGYGADPSSYLSSSEQLCASLRRRIPQMADQLAALPFPTIERAVFLGAGCQWGAAREAALKLTEMTAGRIVASHETFLGLRHGPMAALDERTLIVALLPPSDRPRRYAIDLLQELERKNLGCATVIADKELQIQPARRINPPSGDPILPGAGAQSSLQCGEEFAALSAVATGQLLGFFACLHHGLKPDTPAATGVITRVVEPFPLYH